MTAFPAVPALELVRRELLLRAISIMRSTLKSALSVVPVLLAARFRLFQLRDEEPFFEFRRGAYFLL